MRSSSSASDNRGSSLLMKLRDFLAPLMDFLFSKFGFYNLIYTDKPVLRGHLWCKEKNGLIRQVTS
jgi:hypothetical protein